MRKLLLILLGIILLVVVIVFSFKPKTRNPNDINQFLKNIDTYSTDAKIIIKNNKQKLTYNTKQIYSKELGQIINIDDRRKLIYANDKIYVNDIESGHTYIQENDFDSIFKLSFISEYMKMLYTNEENKYGYETVEEQEFQLTQFIIPGSNRNIDTAVLYVNTNTMKPYKAVIYDYKGKESVEIIYSNFETDIDVDEELFEEINNIN